MLSPSEMHASCASHSAPQKGHVSYLQDCQANTAWALHGVSQRIECCEINALVNAKSIMELRACQPCNHQTGVNS